jgi:Protein of unknown function (DUF2844)
MCSNAIHNQKLTNGEKTPACGGTKHVSIRRDQAMRPKFILRFSMLCWCLALPIASQAALGGALDTVAADQSTMHASRRIADYSGYQVHELTLSSGTVAREYVTPSGTVFAVVWQGPYQPNLDQLLGVHFVRLLEAAKAPHRDHRRLAMHAPDLVIDSGGRMRSFAGRAYLPTLVPTSLTLADIR